MDGLVEPQTAEIDLAEAVQLGATNTEFFARTFFPKAFRVASPPFADAMWEPLENPNDRQVCLMVFRGASKTTRLRTFAAKRIAYGLSRTILYIGASERDAIRSVQWVRTQVEQNALYTRAFNLRPGRKWEETQLEIDHGTFDHRIWLLAAGITGSLRGINFDDYRPDLIIVNDPQTDETAATKEQREKIKDLLLGAVRNSLISRVEEPNAKIVMAITPQHGEDVAMAAMQDPDWRSVAFPCWTPETMDLSVDKQISAWPALFPTEDLRKQKIAAARNNKLSVFTREMECRITSDEESAFRPTWLHMRDYEPTPQDGFTAVLAIDPVPPPSDAQVAKGNANKDYECHYVWGRRNGEYHLLDFARNRGHEPSWSVATALALANRWRVLRLVVETVAYQRTLKWLIEQEMKRRGIYISVVAYTDRRSKYNRIVSTLSGLATNGLLHVSPRHTEFISQFNSYPNVSHDDDLDASAIALSNLSNPYLDRADLNLEDDIESFDYRRTAP